jgi:hypothetical protein
MQTALKVIPATKLYFKKDVSLLDMSRGVFDKLNQRDVIFYIQAMSKVQNKRPLSRSDLAIFNKIDKMTYKKFHMCLKDSVVTKARIEACKSFGIQFIDRDGLVEHMNLSLGMVH